MAYYLTQRIKRDIGQKIRKIREKKHLKQVEVAVEAGINPSYYGKIERGVMNPSLEKIYRIVRALRIHSSEILSF